MISIKDENKTGAGLFEIRKQYPTVIELKEYLGAERIAKRWTIDMCTTI